MTRFQRVTLIFVLLAAASFLLNGQARTTALISLCFVYATLFGLGVPFVRMQYFCPAIIRGPRGQNRIALTFDDGPDPVATPALLELLKRENVRATFFLIGRNVDAYPDIAKQIANAGHLIGNHTYSHRWQSTFTWAGPIGREISRAQDAIEHAIGVKPTLFRPPVGLTTPHYQTALTRVGLTLVAWDVRPMDSAQPADVVIDRVMKATRDGSIIVLHDGNAAAEKITHIVATLISNLRAKGYMFVRVDDLLRGDVSSPSPLAGEGRGEGEIW